MKATNHTQKVEEIMVDCDNDTILLKVIKKVLLVNTGRKTCFFTNLDTNDITQDIKIDTSSSYGVIDTLYHTILEKKRR